MYIFNMIISAILSPGRLIKNKINNDKNKRAQKYININLLLIFGAVINYSFVELINVLSVHILKIF